MQPVGKRRIGHLEDGSAREATSVTADLKCNGELKELALSK